MPRQVALNKHRTRYWLSVGATPTKRVHDLLHMFDMVPKRPSVFGPLHSYEKPGKIYDITHFSKMSKKPSKTDETTFYYKQKL